MIIKRPLFNINLIIQKENTSSEPQHRLAERFNHQIRAINIIFKDL